MKTKPTKGRKKAKRLDKYDEIENFMAYLKSFLGLQNIEFTLSIKNTKSISEEAHELGVRADCLLGRNDSARPGAPGIAHHETEILIVEENHKDLDSMLHTVAHEFIHSKLWWCAPQPGEDRVIETLLEESINRISDICVDAWRQRGRKIST